MERKHVFDPCRHRYGQTLEMIYRTPGCRHRQLHDCRNKHQTANSQTREMTRLLQAPFSAVLLLSCALNASAHGGGGEHAQVVVAPDADWATRHMAGTVSSDECSGQRLTRSRGAPHLWVRRRDLLHAARLRQHRYLDSTRYPPHIRSRRRLDCRNLRDQEANGRTNCPRHVRYR